MWAAVPLPTPRILNGLCLFVPFLCLQGDRELDRDCFEHGDVAEASRAAHGHNVVTEHLMSGPWRTARPVAAGRLERPRIFGPVSHGEWSGTQRTQLLVGPSKREYVGILSFSEGTYSCVRCVPVPPYCISEQVLCGNRRGLMPPRSMIV
jgi:hypothetical protein